MKPTVCAVMLVNGRPEMVARAIRCFLAQTYERKRLLIWDSTPDLICCDQTEHDGVFHIPAAGLEFPYDPGCRVLTIGELRNAANDFWTEYPIIAHWDSDDWSHPRRLEEQVELLERSGKECVGYNEMLFWQTPVILHETGGRRSGDFEMAVKRGEAWLYRLPLPGYALGTSLLYWRKAWERNPFEDKSNGEDTAFLKKVSCASSSACAQASIEIDFGPTRRTLEPRMIATVHGGNTATVIDPAHSEWKRVSEWDARVRAIMEGS